MIQDFLVNHDDSHQVKEFQFAQKYLKGEWIWFAKKKSELRSVGLNDYYWSCIIYYISEATGEGFMTIHEEIKKRFLFMVKWGDNPNDLTTTDLTQDEFWLLLKIVKNWAEIEFMRTDEKQGHIPEPDSIIRPGRKKKKART